MHRNLPRKNELDAAIDSPEHLPGPKDKHGECKMKAKPDLSSLAFGVATALFAMGSSTAVAQDAAQSDDAEEIERIVVTGSRFEQNIEDVAGSISVMTDIEIENQMVTDMSQLFRYEPGIYVSGSKGSAQNIIVRGMGADRVMMTKDGMRMNEGYGADGLNDVVGRGFIDMDTVKQVEVAKGATSSLYGADALGGIVAFVTKDASDFLRDSDFYADMGATYDGPSSETGLGVLTAFRLGSLNTMVSYKDRSGNETANFTDEREHADIDSTNLLVKADYVINDVRTLTFSFEQYEQEVLRPDTGEPKGDYLGLGGWTINLEESFNEKTNDSYRMRYRANDAGVAYYDNLDASVYLNETEQSDLFHLNHDTPAPMGPGGSRDQIKTDLFAQETTGVTFAFGKQLGSAETAHHVSYGFDWDMTESYRPRREQRIQSDGTVTRDDLSAPFPKNDTERLGIYLQDAIEMSGGLSLVPGLRYDYYSMEPKSDDGYHNSTGDAAELAEKITDNHVSFRLGLLQEISGDLTFYAQYAQGFKVPPYDLAYFYFDHVAFSGNGIRIVPSADLVPEESDTYEIGIRGSVGDLDYDLSAYKAEYDNFIQIAYVETVSEINTDFGFPLPLDVDVFQYQNIEAADISGIEFRLNYSVSDDFNLFLNGEWMDSEDLSTGEQLTTIRPLSGTLGATWSRNRFAFDAMLKWADSMDKHPEGAFTTDSYTTLDLFARFAVSDKFSLGVGVLNAFDEDYIEYSSIAGIPDDGRDLTLYSEPGRSISANMKYRF
jgi:hemoglobin/transferrin/lactoferrin receptor protein